MFLSSMSQADAKRATCLHKEVHGIDGMVFSVDCCHIKWKNCPTAWWKGQFKGKEGEPTIMLKAGVNQP